MDRKRDDREPDAARSDVPGTISPGPFPPVVMQTARRAVLFARRLVRDVRAGILAAPTGLSGRLFVVTVIAVLLAEAIVFVPSIGVAYRSWLVERTNAAQIGALVHEASRGRDPGGKLNNDVLARTGALVMILSDKDMREQLYRVNNPPSPEVKVDLGRQHWLYDTQMAFDTLFAPPGRAMYVTGTPLPSGQKIELVIYEAPLRAALIERTVNILLLSLFIAGLTAVVIFAVAYIDLVRPIRRMLRSMVHFQEMPEDASRIRPLKVRNGELADAADALHAMQREVYSALQQKSRLAALGTAVSKINHDLRNLLANAQLLTDSLTGIDNPKVQRLAPKLVSSLDRAVTLCTRTLRYGRAEEAPPQPRSIDLHALVEDVGASLALGADGTTGFRNEVSPGTRVTADPDHLFRILLNLVRNAVQAIEAGTADRAQHVAIRLAGPQPQGRARVIEVEDTGPGIPPQARDRLFQAFVSSARAGGTGLGLAISRELTIAQGGSLDLAHTDENGTVFRITLPSGTPDEA